MTNWFVVLLFAVAGTVTPTVAIDFDTLVTYSVVPGESRVAFDGSSTLHDFSGETREVTGELTVRLSDPATTLEARVSAAAATLDTGNGARDRKMHRLLEVEDHPEITFEAAGFLPENVDREAGTVRGTVDGILTVRGEPRRVKVPVTVAAEGMHLTIEGEFPVKLTDYGIRPPRVLGLIRVADEMKVRLKIVLQQSADRGLDQAKPGETGA